MSVIGPRPQLVRDMVFMTDEQRMRHTAKPGLSGLAQVNGRNAITWEDKLEWDQKYIKKVGLIAAIVNFCMNLILIPRVGVFGAAIASIVAETIGTAIQIIYCISKKQLNAKQIFVPCWKYLLSGSIMLLFVETLKTKFSGGIVSLCVLICTGGLSYVGVLLILRDRFFIVNINKILKRK